VDKLEELEAKRSSELAAPSGSATDDQLIIAFVQGAQWWEWDKEKATMWSSDRDRAETEARVRLSNETLGKSPNGESSHERSADAKR
jgi:hypothetical protein